MERRFGGSRFGGGGRDFGGRGRDNDRRGGFRSDSFEKPVKVGEVYEVEIKEVGSKGDGIARVKNFVVFVANAKQNEKCTIKITSVSNRFAVGEKTSEGASEKAAEEDTEEETDEETEEE